MHRTVGDFILDLTDNSLEAGAGRVDLIVQISGKEIRVSIKDNGSGMDKELLQQIQDPYYTDGIKHPGRKVGLGIPFLIQTVEMCSGDFSISSVPGRGTEVCFMFPPENIDTPPLGDLAETFAMIMLKQGTHEVVIDRRISNEAGTRIYCVKRTELIDALGELDSAASQSLVRQFMASRETEL